MKKEINVKNIVDMDLSNPRTVAHTIQKIIDYITGHAEEIKGEKGVGISNIEVTEQLELLYTLTDGTTKLTSPLNIQNGIDGVGIENIIWNTEQNKFSIYLTDGSVYTSPSLKGEDGEDGVDGSSIYTSSGYLGTGSGTLQLSTINIPSGKSLNIGDIIITNNAQTKGRMAKVMDISGSDIAYKYWTNLTQTSLEIVEMTSEWNDDEDALEFDEMFVVGKMYILEFYNDNGFNGNITFIYQEKSLGSGIGFKTNAVSMVWDDPTPTPIYHLFIIRNNTSRGKGFVSDNLNLGSSNYIRIYKVG